MSNSSSYQTIDISNCKAHPKQSRFKGPRGPLKPGLAGGGGSQTCSGKGETLERRGGASNLLLRGGDTQTLSGEGGGTLKPALARGRPSNLVKPGLGLGFKIRFRVTV